jgi:hypothetical protein
VYPEASGKGSQQKPSAVFVDPTTMFVPTLPTDAILAPLKRRGGLATAPLPPAPVRFMRHSTGALAPSGGRARSIAPSAERVLSRRSKQPATTS